MNVVAVWIELGLGPRAVASWCAAPEANASGAVRVAGVQSGPQLAAWVKSEAVEGLLLMSRPADRGAARYVANVVTGATSGVAVAQVDVPQGGLAAVSAASVALRTPGTASAKLAVLQASLASMTAGAWLKSVTGLVWPRPAFRQHLRSLIPLGPGFVSFAGPQPHVWRKGEPQTRFLPGASLVVGVPEGKEPPELLSQVLSGLPMKQVPAVTVARQAYGAEAIEFLVDEGAGAEVPLFPVVNCRVCGQPLYTVPCSFCHVVPARSEA